MSQKVLVALADAQALSSLNYPINGDSHENDLRKFLRIKV